MLYIKGATREKQAKLPNMLLHPKDTFDSYFEEAWLDSDFGRGLITDIEQIDVMDKSKPVKRILLENELLVDYLATGTKNVFLCKFFNNPEDPSVPLYNRMGFMGENCFKWLLLASLERDIHMVTTVFRKFKGSDFPAGAHVVFEDVNFEADCAYDATTGMLKLSYAGLLEA